ncbi:hypothetical protein INT45_007324 [Circinella minor]|uniref:Uncharacterized protein n=1 Tax=Circinella minor TaxID=1195481 RepID=A0A8H7S0Q0_9FUNG|nr:hypothetical protein INT45_007324 [Circinella minor]
MQSYAEVYQRYFDPDRFAPGSPKTAQKELPRASAYEALVSLKQKYYHDAKKPLDVNDLPTSAPLFDNDELLNRAEQITSDWTHQHPENMPTATKSSVLSGAAVAPSATAAAATAPSESIQDETRRQAQNLWKLWTKNHINQQQQTAAALGDPSTTNKQAPRRASDSVAAVSPNPDGSLGHNTGDYPLHRSSVPSTAQQQNMALGRQSISMYDTDDSEVPEQPTDLNVPHQTAPSNPPVPAPAPIDDQANTGQQAKPVASERPIDQQQQPVDNKDLGNLDQSDDTVMTNQQQPDGKIQGTATEDNAQVAPADDEIQDISSVNNKGPSDTTATAVGAGVATTAAAGTAIAATGGAGNENNDKIEVSSSLKPVISGGGRTLTPQVSFAENDEQPKKEENTVRNTGGTKNHIAEQSELYHNGGLTGTQPVGKIDLKNL